MTGESFSLASGFQTLVKSHEGVESEMRAVRTLLTASMDMERRFGGPGASQGPRSAAVPPAAQANPTAGQTTSQAAQGAPQAPAGRRTFEQVRQAAVGAAGYATGAASQAYQAAPDFLAGQAQRAQQAAQPPRGPFSADGRWGGGGWGGGGGGTPPTAPIPQGPPAGSPTTGGGAGGGGGGLPPSGGGVGGGGEGPGGPIGRFLAQNVPGIGLLNRGLGELRSQQDKNNYYRNIEGGTHGNALGERAREEAYVAQSQLVMGSDEARQAFKGVTRIGYTNRTDQRGAGTSRAQALDYVYEGKKSRGQSVEEGLAQLEVSSRSLSTTLGELNGSMERVSESAGKAGVNTEMARRQMLQNMSVGISRGQGGGAAGFAEAITSTNVSYGRDYATQVGSSAMYSRDMEYRAAGMSGMTPGALRNQQRRDPVGAMRSYQKVIDQSLSTAGITPEMKQWVKSKVEAEGGADALRNNPTLANIIAGEFLDTFLDRMDPNAFTSVLGRMSGQDFGDNVEMAARFFVEQTAGNTMAKNAEKHQMEAQKKSLSSGDMAKHLGEFNGETTSGGTLGTAWGRDRSKASDAYQQQARKSGQVDPVIEAMLKHESLQGDRGDEAKVEVDTKSGKRVVSLDEAVKQFPNQIAAGKVRFVEGEAKGKDVASLTGGKIRSDADWQSEVRKESKAGVSAEEWEKKNGKAGSGQAVLDLTPDAKKLVTFLGAGGTKASSAASGTPPPIDNAGSPVGRGAAGLWGHG